MFLSYSYLLWVAVYAYDTAVVRDLHQAMAALLPYSASAGFKPQYVYLCGFKEKYIGTLFETALSHYCFAISHAKVRVNTQLRV